jgi:hypothetical protein
VAGFLSLFEGERALYANKAALRSGRREAVWLDITEAQRRAWWWRNRGRVVLHGRFENAPNPYGYRGQILAERISYP